MNVRFSLLIILFIFYFIPVYGQVNIISNPASDEYFQRLQLRSQDNLLDFESLPLGMQGPMSNTADRIAEMTKELLGDDEIPVDIVFEENFGGDIKFHHDIKGKLVIQLSLGALEQPSSDDEIAFAIARSIELYKGSSYTRNPISINVKIDNINSTEIDLNSLNRMIDSGYNPHQAVNYAKRVERLLGWDTNLSSNMLAQQILGIVRVKGGNNQFRINENAGQKKLMDQRALLLNIDERISYQSSLVYKVFQIEPDEIFDRYYKPIIENSSYSERKPQRRFEEFYQEKLNELRITLVNSTEEKWIELQLELQKKVHEAFDLARLKTKDLKLDLTIEQIDGLLDLDKRSFSLANFDEMEANHYRRYLRKLEKEKNPKERERLQESLNEIEDKFRKLKMAFTYDKDFSLDDPLIQELFQGKLENILNRFNPNFEKEAVDKYGIKIKILGGLPHTTSSNWSPYSRVDFMGKIEDFNDLAELEKYANTVSMEKSQKPNLIIQMAKYLDTYEGLFSESDYPRLENILSSLNFYEHDTYVDGLEAELEKSYLTILDKIKTCRLDACLELKKSVYKESFKLKKVKPEFFNDLENSFQEYLVLEKEASISEIRQELGGINLNPGKTLEDKIDEYLGKIGFRWSEELITNELLDTFFLDVLESLNYDNVLDKQALLSMLRLKYSQYYNYNTVDILDRDLKNLNSIYSNEEKTKAIKQLFGNEFLNAGNLFKLIKNNHEEHNKSFQILEAKDRKLLNKNGKGLIYELKSIVTSAYYDFRKKPHLKESHNKASNQVIAIYDYLKIDGKLPKELANEIMDKAIKAGIDGLPKYAKFFSKNGNLYNNSDIDKITQVDKYYEMIFKSLLGEFDDVEKATYEYYKTLNKYNLLPIKEDDLYHPGEVGKFFKGIFTKRLLPKKRQNNFSSIDSDGLTDYIRGAKAFYNEYLDGKHSKGLKNALAGNLDNDLKEELFSGMFRDFSWLNYEVKEKDLNKIDIKSLIRFTNEASKLEQLNPQYYGSNTFLPHDIDHIFERVWPYRNINPEVGELFTNDIFIKSLFKRKNLIQIGGFLIENEISKGKSVSEILKYLSEKFKPSLELDEILNILEKKTSPTRIQSKEIHSHRLTENTSSLNKYYAINRVEDVFKKNSLTNKDRINLLRYFIGVDQDLSRIKDKDILSNSLPKLKELYSSEPQLVRAYVLNTLLKGEVNLLNQPESYKEIKSLILGDSPSKEIDKIFDLYLKIVPEREAQTLVSGILADYDPKAKKGHISVKKLLMAAGPLGGRIGQGLASLGVAKGELKNELLSSYDDFFPPSFEDLYKGIEDSLTIGEPISIGGVEKTIKDYQIIELAGSGSVNSSSKVLITFEDGSQKTINIKQQKGNVTGLIDNENIVIKQLTEELISLEDPELARLGRTLEELRSSAYESLRGKGNELDLYAESEKFEKVNEVYSNEVNKETGLRIEVVTNDKEMESYIKEGYRGRTAIYEHIENTKLQNIEDPILREKIALQILEAEMDALEQGKFDPDGHPGNWLIDLDNKRLIRIDYAQFHEFDSQEETVLHKKLMATLMDPSLKNLKESLPYLLENNFQLFFEDIDNLPSSFLKDVKEIMGQKDFPGWEKGPDRLLYITNELEKKYVQELDPDFKLRLKTGTKKYVSSFVRLNSYLEHLGPKKYIKKLLGFLDLDPSMYIVPGVKVAVSNIVKDTQNKVDLDGKKKRISNSFRSCLEKVKFAP